MMTMQACPALNDLIAEKFMGWKTAKPPYNSIWSKKGDDSVLASDFVFKQDWKPSELLSHAWEVVEELRKREYSVEIRADPDSRKWLQPDLSKSAKDWEKTESINHYQCIINKGCSESDSWIVVCDPVANTPELAICWAALKLVEILEKQNARAN